MVQLLERGRARACCELRGDGLRASSDSSAEIQCRFEWLEERLDQISARQRREALKSHVEIACEHQANDIADADWKDAILDHQPPGCIRNLRSNPQGGIDHRCLVTIQKLTDPVG